MAMAEQDDGTQARLGQPSGSNGSAKDVVERLLSTGRQLFLGGCSAMQHAGVPLITVRLVDIYVHDDDTLRFLAAELLAFPCANATDNLDDLGPGSTEISLTSTDDAFSASASRRLGGMPILAIHSLASLGLSPHDLVSVPIPERLDPFHPCGSTSESIRLLGASSMVQVLAAHSARRARSSLPWLLLKAQVSQLVGYGAYPGLADVYSNEKNRLAMGLSDPEAEDEDDGPSWQDLVDGASKWEWNPGTEEFRRWVLGWIASGMDSRSWPAR